MMTRVDLQLRREATAFAFRFECDTCAHFDADHAACSLSYDPAPRHDALSRAEFELCKAFELG
jgi:hypothetical protein